MKKKTFATGLIASTIVFAGFGTAQIASAQTDDGATEAQDNTTTDSVEESTEDGTRGERGARRGGRDGRGCGEKHAVLAEALGIEVDELQAALEEGQSVADIAEANGVDPQTVVDALIAHADERLDTRVEEGRLTEEEAAEKLAEKSERIEDKVFDTEADESS